MSTDRSLRSLRNVLLISPDSDNEGLWVSGEEDWSVIKNNVVPIGLATIAAMTPDEIHVDIWDELVHGRIDSNTSLARDYDLVGITGFKNHLPRSRQIAKVFRERMIPVAVGGPGVSGTPHEYQGDFDILFIGEAEKTWPQFLRDCRQGRVRTEYRQIDKPDLSESPMPKWDSIVSDFPNYAFGSVQTTRGCPFDCEFCDVIYLFGRRARHKPIDRVLTEVEVLQRLGMRNVFFTDDEFIGNPKYCKELLSRLVPLNNSFPRPLSYSTQLTMNLSRSNELLALAADANFNLVFIGIETPNKESLRETNKIQNLRKDLVADVHKILSYGIAIRAGIIVGFDHDDPGIFDLQYEFIQKACLTSVAINMLKAPPGTKLWTRLRQEGRVVDLAKYRGRLGHPRSLTNILPKCLTRVELMQGYRDLLARLHTWESFRDRCCGFVSLVQREPRVNESALSLDEARKSTMLPALSGEAHDAIDDILRHTQNVPFMMRRIKTIILQFAKYLETIELLLPQIDRQIDLELSGELPIITDDRAILIPPAFRAVFPKIFEEVYQRVYVNLREKDELPLALNEVFIDFLVAWGTDFRKLEAHHRNYLNEICDRTCAKMNGEAPQHFRPIESLDVTLSDIKRNRLADDILTSVEQELYKFQHAANRVKS